MPLSKANLSEEINVLFDSGVGKDPENLADRLHVLGDESLQDVKLKLKLRGWFTSNQTLVSRIFLPLWSRLRICHTKGPFCEDTSTCNLFAGLGSAYFLGPICCIDTP